MMITNEQIREALDSFSYPRGGRVDTLAQAARELLAHREAEQLAVEEIERAWNTQERQMREIDDLKARLKVRT